MTSSSRIPEADRIPFLQKLAFTGGWGLDFFAVGMTIWVLWMPYFNIGLGINPAPLGFVLMALLAWNAFLDPVMGNISDNARTRWGRRRPFMVVGAILTAAVFPFLWRLPVHFDETSKIVYLLFIGVVFFSCYSCWAMPYYGLQLELTPNYDERTRLAAWLTLIGKLSYLITGWTMAVLAGPWFANKVTGRPDIVHGLLTCSWFFAGCMLVCGLLPPLFVRERYFVAETSHQPRDPFWQSIRESMDCKPMWMLIGISFFLLFGSTSVASLSQYINIYFINSASLEQASIIAGWKSTILAVTGILCIPLWTWLGEKFDKKNVVALMLCGSMFGHLLNFVCLRPDMPYLQLIPSVFESAAIAAVWLFVPSMKADTSDYDELHTERRREGALNAFYSWFVKAAMTCSMGLGGVVLQISGFNVKLGAQPPDVLQHMKMLYLLLPIAIWSLTLPFIWYYPLNRNRMAAIRSELEVRRGRL